jgi:hypothetical protein
MFEQDVSPAARAWLVAALQDADSGRGYLDERAIAERAGLKQSLAAWIAEHSRAASLVTPDTQGRLTLSAEGRELATSLRDKSIDLPTVALPAPSPPVH